MGERLRREPKEAENCLGDIKIDDMLENLTKKEGRRRTSNSYKKGGDFERHIANLLTERYKKPFARQEGSGARTTTKRLDESATAMLTGDILTPGDCRFKIECKKGYNENNLVDLFFPEDERGGKSTKNMLGEWFLKAQDEARKVHRLPLFIWKPDNKPTLCILEVEVFDKITKGLSIPTRLYWGNVVFFLLSDFLRIEDHHIFDDNSMRNE